MVFKKYIMPVKNCVQSLMKKSLKEFANKRKNWKKSLVFHFKFWAWFENWHYSSCLKTWRKTTFWNQFIKWFCRRWWKYIWYRLKCILRDFVRRWIFFDLNERLDLLTSSAVTSKKYQGVWRSIIVL